MPAETACPVGIDTRLGIKKNDDSVRLLAGEIKDDTVKMNGLLFI